MTVDKLLRVERAAELPGHLAARHRDGACCAYAAKAPEAMQQSAG